MKNNNERLFAALLSFAVLYAIGRLGNEDLIDRERYCHDVFGPNSVYPDYKGLGREICKDVLR